MSCQNAIALALALATATGCGDGAALADDAGPALPGPVAFDGEPAAPAPRALHAVLTEVDFLIEEAPGVAGGFNLDGVVSDGSDTESCKRKDYTAPDGTPGIDNQIAALWPLVQAVGGAALDGLVQGAINEGSLTLILSLGEVDDTANDSEVTLTMRKGEGQPLLATYGLLLPGQTLWVDPKAPVSTTANAAIAGGQVSAGPFEFVLPVRFFGVSATLNVQGTLIAFKRLDDGSIEGTFGGGVLKEQLRDIVKQADQGNGGGIASIIEPVLDGYADLGRVKGQGCTQISVAMRFRGVPVHVAGGN